MEVVCRWHQASGFRRKPSSAVWRVRVANVCCDAAFTFVRAHDRRFPIGKHSGHRRQIADVPIHDAEKSGDGGLIGGDAVEIAHAVVSSLLPIPLVAFNT